MGGMHVNHLCSAIFFLKLQQLFTSHFTVCGLKKKKMYCNTVFSMGLSSLFLNMSLVSNSKQAYH